MVTGNHSFRAVGSTGCFERGELFCHPRGLAFNYLVPVYSDARCQVFWMELATQAVVTGDNTKMIDRIVHELKVVFKEVADEITRPINVGYHFFPSAW
jgi:hypothetical protein